jgi:hypothetical protein
MTSFVKNGVTRAAYAIGTHDRLAVSCRRIQMAAAMERYGMIPPVTIYIQK